MLPHKRAEETVHLTVFTVLCLAAIGHSAWNLFPLLAAWLSALAMALFVLRHVPRARLYNDRGRVVYEYPAERHRPVTWAAHRQIFDDYRAYLRRRPGTPLAEIAPEIGTNAVTLSKVIQEARLGYFNRRGAAGRLLAAIWQGKIKIRP